MRGNPTRKNILIEIAAGQTGYKNWWIFTGKSGKVHRIKMLDHTAGQPCGDADMATLSHFLRSIKELHLDALLAGILPEWVELRLITRNETVIRIIKANKSQSIALETLANEIHQLLKQFRQWAVTLPPPTAQRKAA